MPRKIDSMLAQAAIPCTVSDNELDDLRQEIVWDISAVLMLGEPRSPKGQHPVRLKRADLSLRSFCRALLRNNDVSTQLARIADSLVDPQGALYFGCLLNLARKYDGALWWWQFAAGAGDPASAYCLYLFHTRRGDLRDARHWWNEYRALGPRDGDFFQQPDLTMEITDTSSTLREAVDHLKVEEAAGEFHHPAPELAHQIEDLVEIR
ncbi:hypothetical protein ABZ650_33070 [Streptomyces griseoviridis]|uniref:hypothetical protein n=1 Tax=Streptomyces griseoviridis TaxID=45398 RepID=UPI0033C53149